MTELRCTLLTDGVSDQALVPVLRWLLIRNGVDYAIDFDWADLRQLRNPLRGLTDRIAASIDYYPCDLLFIHRDAEREPRENRVQEIRRALDALGDRIIVPVVCVIPVRMLEAWLLLDEMAIRRAAGNPHGRVALVYPFAKSIEDLPDPKETLNELLRQASGLKGRRRAKIPLPECVRRVTEYAEDFSPLRQLPAFRRLEEDIRSVLAENGWVGAR